MQTYLKGWKVYKRILVPLDGSQLAENVLPVVQSLSRGIKSKVTLFSVIDVEAMADELPAGRMDLSRSIDQMAQNAITVAKDYLKSVASTLDLPKGTVTQTAVLATAADAIVKEAEKQPGTMIAMSTHGRSGFQRYYIGSVADKVLHTASVPVLLYNPHSVVGITATRHLNKIIVPLDGTPGGEKAIPHAEVLASTLDLKIVLVRVIPTILMIQSNEWYQSNFPDWSIIELQKNCSDYLKEIASHLAKRGFKNVETRVELGKAASAIVGLAQSTPGSIIAMPSRSRPGLGHVLGSVTEKVVRSSDVPTFIIPPGRD